MGFRKSNRGCPWKRICFRSCQRLLQVVYRCFQQQSQTRYVTCNRRFTCSTSKSSTSRRGDGGICYEAKHIISAVLVSVMLQHILVSSVTLLPMLISPEKL